MSSSSKPHIPQLDAEMKREWSDGLQFLTLTDSLQSGKTTFSRMVSEFLRRREEGEGMEQRRTTDDADYTDQ